LGGPVHVNGYVHAFHAQNVDADVDLDGDLDVGESGSGRDDRVEVSGDTPPRLAPYLSLYDSGDSV